MTGLKHFRVTYLNIDLVLIAHNSLLMLLFESSISLRSINYIVPKIRYKSIYFNAFCHSFAKLIAPIIPYLLIDQERELIFLPLSPNASIV